MATTTTNNTLFKVLMVLAIIGAINWGLIGFFNWNLVDALLGGGAREETSALSRIVYAIVGLSGLLSLVPIFSRQSGAARPGPSRA